MNISEIQNNKDKISMTNYWIAKNNSRKL